MDLDEAIKKARLTKRQKELLEQIPQDRWASVDEIDGGRGTDARCYSFQSRLKSLQNKGLVACVVVDGDPCIGFSKTYYRKVRVSDCFEFLHWRTGKENRQFLDSVGLKITDRVPRLLRKRWSAIWSTPLAPLFEWDQLGVHFAAEDSK
jgi:hypothetical protein